MAGDTKTNNTSKAHKTWMHLAVTLAVLILPASLYFFVYFTNKLDFAVQQRFRALNEVERHFNTGLSQFDNLFTFSNFGPDLASKIFSRYLLKLDAWVAARQSETVEQERLKRKLADLKDAKENVIKEKESHNLLLKKGMKEFANLLRKANLISDSQIEDQPWKEPISELAISTAVLMLRQNRREVVETINGLDTFSREYREKIEKAQNENDQLKKEGKNISNQKISAPQSMIKKTKSLSDRYD